MRRVHKWHFLFLIITSTLSIQTAIAQTTRTTAPACDEQCQLQKEIKVIERNIEKWTESLYMFTTQSKNPGAEDEFTDVKSDTTRVPRKLTPLEKNHMNNMKTKIKENELELKKRKVKLQNLQSVSTK